MSTISPYSMKSIQQTNSTNTEPQAMQCPSLYTEKKRINNSHYTIMEKTAGVLTILSLVALVAIPILTKTPIPKSQAKGRFLSPQCCIPSKCPSNQSINARSFLFPENSKILSEFCRNFGTTPNPNFFPFGVRPNTQEQPVMPVVKPQVVEQKVVNDLKEEQEPLNVTLPGLLPLLGNDSLSQKILDILPSDLPPPARQDTFYKRRVVKTEAEQETEVLETAKNILSEKQNILKGVKK